MWLSGNWVRGWSSLWCLVLVFLSCHVGPAVTWDVLNKSPQRSWKMGAETLSTNPLASLDSVKGVTRSAVWLLCGPPTTPFSTKGWDTGVWEVVRMQRHRVLTLAGGPPGWLGVSCMVHSGWCSHVTFWELGQGWSSLWCLVLVFLSCHVGPAVTWDVLNKSPQRSWKMGAETLSTIISNKIIVMYFFSCYISNT